MSNILSINSGDFYCDIDLSQVDKINMASWRKIARLAHKFYDPQDSEHNINNAYNRLIGLQIIAQRDNDKKRFDALKKRFDVIRKYVEGR